MAFLMAFSCWNCLYAQEEKTNKLTLSTGYGSLARQDIIHSPFVHSGSSMLNFGVAYHRNKNFIQFLEGNYNVFTAPLIEPYTIELKDHHMTTLPHIFLFMNLNYGFGKAVKKTEKQVTAIGGSVLVDLQSGFYNYGFERNLGYFYTNNLNIWLQKSYVLNDRNKLSGRVELPVLSWLARSPYLVNDDEFIENVSSHKRPIVVMEFIKDGKLATLNKYQRLNFLAEYHYEVSRSFNIGASYRFQFIHHNEPRTLLSYQNNLNLTTTLKF